jgi:hypothetical protein
MTNGLLLPCLDADSGALLPAARVVPFAESDRENMLSLASGEHEVADEDYFVYDDAQDPVNYRPEYIPTCIAISEFVDSCIILLNPSVAFDGDHGREWECWVVDWNAPGAYRYDSLLSMLSALRSRTVAGAVSARSFLRWRSKH